MQRRLSTWRAFLIGILLIPVCSYWTVRSETVGRLFYSTTSSLFCNVIFILFVIALLSEGIKFFFPSGALARGELLIIYSMLSVSTALSGEGVGQQLIRYFGTPFWRVTPENEWTELFHRHLPKWSMIEDKSILKAFFEGNDGDPSLLYTAEHLKAWLFPLLIWCMFVLVLVFVMLCINVIVRRQWIEYEKLTYPVIQLPLAMTTDRGNFLRNRGMWTGFSIGAGITLLNGGHFLVPAIPGIRNIYDISSFFATKPWGAMKPMTVAFYPCAIGLAYFMPLDLAFSTWFFFLFWKAQLIAGSILGMRSLPGFPYAKFQQTGAYLAVGLLALWTSRRHIFYIFKTAWKKESSENDSSSEPMGYRSAILGLVIGSTLIVLFGMRIGMIGWVAVSFFGVYFILSIAVTRMRAELGPLVHELYYSNAGQVITAISGTRKIPASSLTAISMFWWLLRSQNSHPMPHQLEAFKLSERSGIRARPLLIYMLIAAALGMIFCSFAVLDTSYRHGTTAGFAYEGYFRLQGWLSAPRSTDGPQTTFMTVGVIFTIFLLWMKRRFLWWPFHPLGYAVTQGDWAITFIWFPILISWFAKSIILKYGGLQTHRKATPIFLGLILGDFVMGASWGIIGLIAGISTYPFKNW